MKVLITGASGFVAPYLEKELKAHRYTVIKTSLTRYYRCDLSRFPSVNKLIQTTKPDAIVHLAGLSQTGESNYKWKDYFRANVVTTKNLCEALSSLPGARTFLLASSGMVYGKRRRARVTFSETSSLKPSTNYGRSKWMAEKTVRSYASKNFHAYITRPFNHIGPGQSTAFVAAAFAKRIEKAKAGATIQVGDLRAFRDFTDVRDIVRAYRIILQKKPREKVFVLGSGRPVKIQIILDELLKISKKKLKVAVDANLSSSRSVSSLASNPKLARRILGWRSQIPLKKSIKDIYKSFTSF